MLRIYSHNQYSAGARELAKALGIKRIKHNGETQFVGHPGDTIINWGSSTAHQSFGSATILNKPELCNRTGDKRAFFNHIGQLTGDRPRVPEWTCAGNIASEWVNSGNIVVARKILRGHSGAGIEILEPGVDFVDAPLYTKYVKKDSEYRVHCFKIGADYSVVDLQRKIKSPSFTGEPNWRVRNHQNGFIYVRNNVQAPEDVTRQALLALKTSGLDFGAVDVIWNKQQGKVYVLEINTAPGLTGITVQNYKGAFQQLFASS